MTDNILARLGLDEQTAVEHMATAWNAFFYCNLNNMTAGELNDGLAAILAAVEQRGMQRVWNAREQCECLGISRDGKELECWHDPQKIVPHSLENCPLIESGRKGK